MTATKFFAGAGPLTVAVGLCGLTGCADTATEVPDANQPAAVENQPADPQRHEVQKPPLGDDDMNPTDAANSPSGVTGRPDLAVEPGAPPNPTTDINGDDSAAAGSPAAYGDRQREDLVAQAKLALEEADRKIAMLEGDASATADPNSTEQTRLEELKSQRQQVSERIDELEAAPTSNMETQRSALDEALEELKSDLDQA